MQNPRLLILFCLVPCLPAPPAPGQEATGARIPVPEAGKLRSSEAEVREVFKEDYASQDPRHRKPFAQKLLKNALETNDDPPIRYVLLKETAGQAARAGDLATGLQALHELGRGFQVDVIPLKLAFLSEAAKLARTPEEGRLLAEAHLFLSLQALDAQSLEGAEQSAAAALAASKMAQSLPLITRAEARVREIAAVRAASDLLKRSREALLKNPEDGAANLAVGRHECLVRGEWKAGLPLLARGDDPALAELAKRELAGPGTAQEQGSLADLWWNQADKEVGEGRYRARKRGAEWYGKARDGLSGLARARAEKRISDARGEERSPGLVGLWAFEEGAGTSAADVSGSGGTATLYPGASWAAGVTGGALRLDGVRGYAAVADAPAIDLDADSFTVACFVRPEGTNACRVVNKWHLEEKRGWMMDINSVTGGNPAPEVRVGRLRTRIADGTFNVDFTVDANLLPEAWNHIALVLDRTAREARLYAQGVQVGPGSSFASIGSVRASVPLGIGCIPPATGGFFNGCIDDLRIYRRALTAPEIRELAGRK
jgi:hypothetical protein